MVNRLYCKGKFPKSKCGEVVKSDDNTVNVFSSVEQSNVKVALPYGLYSVPVVGENSVIIPTETAMLLWEYVTTIPII